MCIEQKSYCNFPNLSLFDIYVIMKTSVITPAGSNTGLRKRKTEHCNFDN